MCKIFNKIFRGGNPSGNIPSPRVNMPWAGIRYSSVSETLTVNLSKETHLITVQNTNSMEPLIDIGHRLVVSADPTFIAHVKPGDVIIWQQGSRYVIHSVVEQGQDIGGIYYRTQGLHLYRKDPEKVRPGDILYVCLGVFWTRGEGDYTAEEGD